MKTFLLTLFTSISTALAANDKTLDVGGVTVKILGQSGKINIENGDSTVQVTMDALREIDANGNIVGKKGNPKHSINTFATTDFTFGAEETEVDLLITNSTDGTNYTDVGKGVKINFFSTLATGSKLNVEAIVVTEGGIAGSPTELFNVRPGDFKWNIKLEDWDFCGCNDGEAAFVELDIEIKGTASADSLADLVGNLGNETISLGENINLELSHEILVNDGDWSQMPEGYPKLSVADDKTTFTFRFPRFDGSALYDPIIGFHDDDSAASLSEGNGMFSVIVAGSLSTLLYFFMM